MARFFVLQTSAEHSAPREVPTARPLVLGRAELYDERAAERHLALTAKEDGVVLEQLRGATGTTLNDVQLSGQAIAKAGDQIGVGRARLLVMAQTEAAPGRPRLASHDEMMARLADEVARAGVHRPCALLLVTMPPLNTPARLAMLRRLVDGTARHAPVTWGELAGDTLMAVVSEAQPDSLKTLRTSLPTVAGPRALSASAVSPGDGIDAEALLEAALARLGAPVHVDFTVHDPVMVRLHDSAAVTTRRGTTFWVEGPSGSGRSTLARALFSSVTEVTDVDAPPVGDLWLWREAARTTLDALRSLQQRAAHSKARLIITASEPPLLTGVDHHLMVPALVDRPADIVPLADAFLSAERRRLSRPRLLLGADAKGLLGRYRWPGNVRELRNVMAFAARAAVRDEIGRDALPVRLTHEAPADSFRGALESTERELLLEALSRTRWNVTAAANRLGMPRRTVVYRMAKLGLRRPAR